MSGVTGARPMRADARANYERLLTQARLAFAEYGTGASLEEIARRAGVGTGMFYRHFPSREALLEAVLHDRFGCLTARAGELSATAAPGPALTAWLRELVEFTGPYRGLPPRSCRRCGTPRPSYTRPARPCATPARPSSPVRSGRKIRPDLDALELFTLVSGVAWAYEQTSAAVSGRVTIDRLLALALEGLNGPDMVR